MSPLIRTLSDALLCCGFLRLNQKRDHSMISLFHFIANWKQSAFLDSVIQFFLPSRPPWDYLSWFWKTWMPRHVTQDALNKRPCYFCVGRRSLAITARRRPIQVTLPGLGLGLLYKPTLFPDTVSYLVL
jgi:hypothetical protein